MARTANARWDIDEVLARTDLGALLDEYAEPTGSAQGRRWHCPVPDHTDTNASVTMHRDARNHERWRCWSGDDTHRGDAIDLVMVARHVDRRDAIEELASRAGLHRDQPLPPRPVRPPPAPSPTPTRLDPKVVDYVEACGKILWTRTGRPVLDWLIARGLEPETLFANRVGADPSRAMLRRSRGLPSGRSPAATFPALDPDGSIKYVQARYLQPEDGPKYENPGSGLGPNPRLAWTVATAHAGRGVIVVCEGIPDALTAAQAGYSAVAILGSQAPDRSVAARLTERATALDVSLVAIADADLAGRQWATHLTNLLRDHGQAITVVTPPGEGLDLNTWAQEDPRWTTVLSGATTVGEGRPALRIVHPRLEVPTP